ncbi:MAG: GNAT family N-acetyltransferase [Ornithinibacter sp.]
MTSEISVTHNRARHRWEAWIGEDLAGFATYHRSEGVIDFRHTEVDPAFTGLGVGGILVRTALDEVAEGADRVVPSCPFVAEWMGRHPEYEHLTTSGAG